VFSHNLTETERIMPKNNLARARQ